MCLLFFCKSQKLHAFARMINSMDPAKKRCLMETFITFQFSDYPFIWMFHNRKLNRWLNRIRQRAFKLIYNNNYQFSFSELLEKENSISTHNRIMLVLDVEIYILKIDIAPEIMNIQEAFSQPKFWRKFFCTTQSWNNIWAISSSVFIT